MILTKHRGLDLAEILDNKLTDHLPEEDISLETRIRGFHLQEGTPPDDTELCSDIHTTHVHPFVVVLGTKGGL
ncbi:MAG: hypothetical protein QF415_17545 [Candidatus Undinarchaeales archaeon]|jgi:hypothetical protein|nr:hypothetical protein [Candidatus Undinarchaeales archaeon]MDP7493995.1 hypothetical protein [Candidatus Undinarchaeales archaeon]